LDLSLKDEIKCQRQPSIVIKQIMNVYILIISTIYFFIFYGQI